MILIFIKFLVYGENPPHLHFDVRYLLEAEHKDHLLIASNESHEIAWVNKKEVLNKNPEDSISRMLHKMKKY